MGKVSHGKYFFCAISNIKELNCWKFDQQGTKLVDVPNVFKEGTVDVSVGQASICAISKRKTLICWL